MAINSIVDKFSYDKLHSYVKKLSFFPTATIALVIIFGLFFSFRVAPFQSSDEPNHYLRAYSISKLHFTARPVAHGRYGYMVPQLVATFTNDYLAMTFQDERNAKPQDTKWAKVSISQAEHSPIQPVNTENTAIYPPINYIPQALALAVAHLFNMSMLDGFYLGRLFSLFAFILVLLLAFRLLPKRCHPILFVVATIPTLLQQITAYSADGFSIELAILLVSYIIHVLSTHKKPDFKRVPALLILFGLMFFMALSKQVYFLICFAVLPVIWVLIKNKKRAIIASAASIIVTLAATLSWNHIVGKIGLNFAVLAGSKTIHPSSQIKLMLHHPLHFLKAVYLTVATPPSNLSSTVNNYSRLIVSGMVGKLASTSRFLPEFAVVAAYFSMFIAVLKNNSDPLKSKFALSTKFVLYYLAIFVLIFLGVFATIYVTYTDYGSPIVTGVVGRYFLPAAVLVLLILPLWDKMPKLSINLKTVKVITFLIATMNLLLMSRFILDRYFV